MVSWSNRFETDAHSVLMCIKVFILRHHFDSPSDATDSFFRDMLECNLSVEAVKIDSAVSHGIAVCR